MKKLFQVVTVLEILLAVFLYFVLNFEFDNDVVIYNLLASTGFDSTIMRLSVYLFPGIFLIGGLFGVVLDNKKILIFMGIVQIFAAFLTMLYSGNSITLFITGIIALILSTIYLLAIIFYQKNKSSN